MTTKYKICYMCKNARKARGITLNELSKMCGVNKDYLSRFENGNYSVNILQEYYAHILYESETNAIKELIKEV